MRPFLALPIALALFACSDDDASPTSTTCPQVDSRLARAAAPDCFSGPPPSYVAPTTTARPTPTTTLRPSTYIPDDVQEMMDQP
jgi:hypothetical protein